MKAVILAAGRGTRLEAVTNGRCKCLVRVGGQTILDHQIGSLVRAGVSDIGIVVGYGSEQIVEHVQRVHPARAGRIHYLFNPDFATTNNMYSLWTTREWLAGQGFVCINGDVLCHPDIVTMAVAGAGDISVVLAPEFRDETTKVITNNGHVVAITKSITERECSGTFVGIATFSPAGAEALFDRAEAMFAAGSKNQYFNDVINYLAIEGTAVGYTDSGLLPWAEIDDGGDLEYALSHVVPHVEEPAERRIAV